MIPHFIYTHKLDIWTPFINLMKNNMNEKILHGACVACGIKLNGKSEICWMKRLWIIG